MHLAQELVASQEHLASLPSIYYKVREALADAEISVNDLAKTIAIDPSLTATLLRIANSAFYGFPRKIETLSRAISLIGMDQVSDVVLASSLAFAFQGIRPQRMDMNRFWRGSIRRALLCKAFARHLGDRGDSERMFVIGLLSDAGHLVMYRAIPDLMGVVLDRKGGNVKALAQHEREIIGCDYAEVGAALCAAWRLPVSMGATIGSQLDPMMAGDHVKDAAILNLAIIVAEAQENGERVAAESEWLSPDVLELSGVDLALLPIMAEESESQLDSVLQSFAVS